MLWFSRILLLLLVAPATAFAQDWQELGTSATGEGLGGPPVNRGSPCLAAGPDGTLVAAWSGSAVAGTSHVYVLRWDGSAWGPMGPSMDANGIGGPSSATHPSVAVDAEGIVTVAWVQLTALGAIKVARFDPAAGAWTLLPAMPLPTPTAGTAGDPSLTLDSAGVPVVAWSQWSQASSGHLQIYIRRLDPLENQWKEMGEGSASGEGISQAPLAGLEPSVAIDGDGVTWVAWCQQRWDPDLNDSDIYNPTDIHVKSWDGSSWMSRGMPPGYGGISGTGKATQPSLAVAASGSVHVAWTEGLGSNRRIHLKRLSPGSESWAGLSGSAEGQGISQGEASTGRDPVVRIDGNGLPYVLWIRAAAGNQESVRLRYHHPIMDAWMSLGGSDEDSGIAASKPGSYRHSLAIDDRNNPVAAWVSASVPAGCIHLRRFDVAPSLSSPQQFRVGGQSEIPPGGLNLEHSEVVLKGIVTQPEGRPLTMEVEIREVGGAGAPLPAPPSAPVSSDSTATVTVTGLTVGKTYVWQAWAVDDLGRPGTRGPEISFLNRANEAPTAIGPAQFFATTGELLEPGGRTLSGVVIRATIADADDDEAALAIEVCPSEVAFSDVATTVSPLGSEGEISIEVFPDRIGPYHWQYCAIDQFGEQGPWKTYGTDEFGVDFELVVLGGSAGRRLPCQSIATGGVMTPVLGLLLALVLPSFRRRGPIL